MDELFTPEVINKVLELLSTATETGGTVLIIYILLPLAITIITTSAWLYGFIKLFQAIKEFICRLSDNKLETEKLKHKPKEWKLHANTINEDVNNELQVLISQLLPEKGGYIHSSDLSKLKRAVRSVNERTKTSNDNS